jgi:D-lactate dehydrogenase
MALLYFYDATELDQKQLGEALSGTDHRWEFVADKIDPANCNTEAEVISVFVTSTVTREVIEAMPKLRLIACRSTGFNHIDFEAANEHNITVVNVPTYGENTVAEYAFAMLLALTRNLPAVLATENQQYAPPDLNGHDLAAKVLGVIGTGHIGLKTLQIAAGFSMETLAHDPYAKPELQEEYGFKYVELDELLTRSDVVSLHVPYLPSTHHIMNRENLEKMKTGAILINTARGELVDTAALTDLLDSGHLGGAVIDVVEGEILLNHREETALLRSRTLPDSVLRHSVEIDVLKKMPNVIVSPHNAYNTVEAIKRINDTTSQNIIDFWYDKSPNKVSPPPKPRGKLILVRHGQSRWNATGQWTGLTDIPLDDKGFNEASELGQLLKSLDIPIDYAYYTELIRSRETLEGMFNAAQLFHVPIETAAAFNERDYGVYTGRNKWQVKDDIGEDAFQALRRGFDVEVPEGETLKDVYNRAVPFYKERVLPQLISGQNILISAHGNSIRALMKYLDNISDEDISNLEMLFGQIVVYEVDDDGRATSKIIHAIDASAAR